MIGQDNNQFFLYDGVKDELVLSIDPDGNVTVTIGATCPFLSNNPDAKPICKTIKSVKAIRKGE
jgi:hypothetical protein